MHKFYHFFFLFLIFSPLAFSKNIELKKDGRTIFIKEKKAWKIGQNLFGMPYILFSPRENGQRSNISFTDTGANLKLDLEDLKSNQDKFHQSKTSWAKKVGANIKALVPYETFLNTYGHRIHQIGLAYEFNQKKYNETSYYIECRGRIIFSKSLRLEQSQTHGNEFKDLIQNLDCGGV